MLLGFFPPRGVQPQQLAEKCEKIQTALGTHTCVKTPLRVDQLHAPRRPSHLVRLKAICQLDSQHTVSHCDVRRVDDGIAGVEGDTRGSAAVPGDFRAPGGGASGGGGGLVGWQYKDVERDTRPALVMGDQVPRRLLVVGWKLGVVQLVMMVDDVAAWCSRVWQPGAR